MCPAWSSAGTADPTCAAAPCAGVQPPHNTLHPGRLSPPRSVHQERAVPLADAAPRRRHFRPPHPHLGAAPGGGFPCRPAHRHAAPLPSREVLLWVHAAGRRVHAGAGQGEGAGGSGRWGRGWSGWVGARHTLGGAGPRHRMRGGRCGVGHFLAGPGSGPLARFSERGRLMPTVARQGEVAGMAASACACTWRSVPHARPSAPPPTPPTPPAAH